MEPLLTNDILNLMRRIGDPRVDDSAAAHVGDEARKKLMKEVREKGLPRILDDTWLSENAADYGLKKLLEEPGTPPDPRLVKTACDLFARYGSEIAAALLLAALPEAYAANEGSKVLAQRSQLINGGELSTRRIGATAQFVIWVLTPGPLPPPVSADMHQYTYQSFVATKTLWGASEGQALRASLALRIMHGLIRTLEPPGIQTLGTVDAGDVALNQEDLLATLLSFTITVFEVLEKFGISWTDEDQEAYFYVWDRVGETLGIGDESVIEELTGCDSFEELRAKLRSYDEDDRFGHAEEGLPDTEPTVVVEGNGNGNGNGEEKGDSVAETGGGETGGGEAGGGEGDLAVPPRAGRLTPDDVDRLFKGRRNRQVLRRIADVGTLRPESVPEARALLARLRERMWTLANDRPPLTEPFEYENFNKILEDVSAGRVLLRAMVDEVAAQLPASQKTWPISVIRQLVPLRVQNRLALGGTSSIGLLSGILDAPRDLPGSVALRRMSAEVLRQRATRVADSLFLDYYDKGQIVIPGLRSTALGYGVRR